MENLSYGYAWKNLYAEYKFIKHEPINTSSTFVNNKILNMNYHHAVNYLNETYGHRYFTIRDVSTRCDDNLVDNRCNVKIENEEIKEIVGWY